MHGAWRLRAPGFPGLLRELRRLPGREHAERKRSAAATQTSQHTLRPTVGSPSEHALHVLLFHRRRRDCRHQPTSSRSPPRPLLTRSEQWERTCDCRRLKPIDGLAHSPAGHRVDNRLVHNPRVCGRTTDVFTCLGEIEFKRWAQRGRGKRGAAEAASGERDCLPEFLAAVN